MKTGESNKVTWGRQSMTQEETRCESKQNTSSNVNKHMIHGTSQHITASYYTHRAPLSPRRKYALKGNIPNYQQPHGGSAPWGKCPLGSKRRPRVRGDYVDDRACWRCASIWRVKTFFYIILLLYITTMIAWRLEPINIIKCSVSSIKMLCQALLQLPLVYCKWNDIVKFICLPWGVSVISLIVLYCVFSLMMAYFTCVDTSLDIVSPQEQMPNAKSSHVNNSRPFYLLNL